VAEKIKDKDGQGHSKRWLQQLIEDAAVEHFFVLASRQHHGWHGHIPRAHLCATSQIHRRYLEEVLKHAPAQLPFEEAWCMRLANTDFTHADQAAAACTYPCDVLSLFA